MALERDSSEDDGDGNFEDMLAEEEGLEGLGEERGLEETLEKLGFGMLGALFESLKTCHRAQLSPSRCLPLEAAGTLRVWLVIR